MSMSREQTEAFLKLAAQVEAASCIDYPVRWIADRIRAISANNGTRPNSYRSGT